MASAPNIGNSQDSTMEEGNASSVQTGKPIAIDMSKGQASFGRPPLRSSEEVGQRAFQGALSGRITSTRTPGGKRRKTRRNRTKKRSVKGKWTRKK
jgi:hypothetical protein